MAWSRRLGVRARAGRLRPCRHPCTSLVVWRRAVHPQLRPQWAGPSLRLNFWAPQKSQLALAACIPFASAPQSAGSTRPCPPEVRVSLTFVGRLVSSAGSAPFDERAPFVGRFLVCVTAAERVSTNPPPLRHPPALPTPAPAHTGAPTCRHSWNNNCCRPARRRSPSFRGGLQRCRASSRPTSRRSRWPTCRPPSRRRSRAGRRARSTRRWSRSTRSFASRRRRRRSLVKVPLVAAAYAAPLPPLVPGKLPKPSPLGCRRWGCGGLWCLPKVTRPAPPFTL